MVELDEVLWATYRPPGPCSDLRGAVDVEDQAVLGNREDLNLLIEGESAVFHSLYILHAPIAKGDPSSAMSSPHPGIQLLPPPFPLASLLQGYSHWGSHGGVPHAFPGLWWEWG